VEILAPPKNCSFIKRRGLEICDEEPLKFIRAKIQSGTSE